MITGWIRARKVYPEGVLVADVCAASRSRLSKLGVKVSSNNNDAAHFGDVIVLAVKVRRCHPRAMSRQSALVRAIVGHGAGACVCVRARAAANRCAFGAAPSQPAG